MYAFVFVYFLLHTAMQRFDVCGPGVFKAALDLTKSFFKFMPFVAF